MREIYWIVSGRSIASRGMFGQECSIGLHGPGGDEKVTTTKRFGTDDA